MRHRDLIRAVARATGETECTIRHRGFSIVEFPPMPLEVEDSAGDEDVADPVHSDELLVATSVL